MLSLARVGRRLPMGLARRVVGGHSSALLPRCDVMGATNKHAHHPPKNLDQRHRLHIGFASLSSALPFTSEETTMDEPSKLRAGDTALDPQATIMLTSLRGGVSSFDCPAPPSIESNKRLPSGAESTTCWSANRQSEVQLARAFDQAWEELVEEDDSEALRVLNGEEGASVTMTCRLGYRSAVVLSEDEVKDAKDTTETNDCVEREGAFGGDARVGMLYAGKSAEDAEDEVSQPAVVLVHNLSKEYVLHSLRTSPLVQQYKLDKENVGSEGGPAKKVQLLSVAHNPETQIAAYLLSHHGETGDAALLEKAHEHMKQSLTSAFVGYEIAVTEGLIDGYGVDSNGLSLPESHDMHFGWRDVLECAANAYAEVNGDNVGGRASLKVIRLPGNVLETRGLTVANEICSFFGDGNEGDSTEEGLPSFTDDETDPEVHQKRALRKLRKVLPESVEVYVTRPLTAYPYGGTGWGPSSPGLAESSGAPPLFLNGEQDADSSGDSDGKKIDATHPIRILDYQIEAGAVGKDPSLVWSNHHYQQLGARPASYQPILNAALSHFDADEILEASRERDLTMEERETLDGCKLLRDMIHDLDASLDTMKSYAAYEEYLMNKAVPLIYGAFEELDEESTGYLQLFFRVHGMAVRMAVARWTRDLLLAGWNSGEDDASATKDKSQEKTIANVWTTLGFGDFDGGYNIPEEQTLQEFALGRLLKEDAVRGLVIGCSRPEHVLEAMRVADSSDNKK
ncbi:hypothetical protein ACHAXT_011467 [Thalassiosira profunda]